MVAVKSHQADAFLKAADRVPSAVLLYGSDAGLVAERAAGLAQRLAERDNPPGEILRMDDASLEEDPGRIFVELQTAPMFGGRKVVRAQAGRRVTAAALKPLLSAGNLEGVLIVEAGSLRPDDAMRALFEKTPGAAAVACFPDEARDLDALVREVFAASGAQITPEAKRMLLARLGADRVLSRAEIEKLALYAAGKDIIDESDVEASVGDAAEMALDRIVLAAASGRLPASLSECTRAVAAGESPQGIIAAIQGHFLRLHRMRGAMESGKSLDEVIRGLRPPPHFKQREALEQQCRDWSLARLNSALARIAETAKAARLNSAMEATLCENLLLELGRLARAKAATTQARQM